MLNKLCLQETLNLRSDAAAPLCFWPTRLESTRAGCRLLAETLPVILERYRRQGLQIVFVADGDFQCCIRDILHRLDVKDRTAVCDFDARIYRLAYGAADFILMPLQLDPCALPCRIAQRYGALPIAYDAGAIHDCVEHLDPAGGRGTGFLFKHFDADGFLWALDQAMAFFDQPEEKRKAQVQRIMADSLVLFDHGETALHLIGLYERIIGRSIASRKAAPDVTVASRIAA